MPWPPDIAEQLPAPRDDEPAGLRHDIADELVNQFRPREDKDQRPGK